MPSRPPLAVGGAADGAAVALPVADGTVADGTVVAVAVDVGIGVGIGVGEGVGVGVASGSPVRGSTNV